MEIVARGPKALKAYHRAIEEGKTSVKRVPIMFIGQGQSGKTSLKRSLIGEEFNPEESSTIGIETDPSYCKVSTEVWKMGEATHERDSSMEPISFEKHTAQYIVNSLEKNERRKELKPSPSRYDNVYEKKGGPSSLNNNCVSSGAPKVKAVPEEIASLVTRLLQVVRVDEDKDEIFSTLWDFGGQSVYYSTHPLFLTRGAIYLLVYNLNRNPEEKSISRVKRGLFKSIKDVLCERSNMDYLDFWMSSVSSLVPNSEKPHETPSTSMQPELLQPPVILVFTHADKPYKGADPEELASEIFGNLQKKSYGKQILDYFVVDNTKSGSKVECEGVISLRKEVLDIAKKLLQLKEVIPIKWLRFEKALRKMVKDGIKWVHVENAKIIARKICGISIEEQFLTMLNLLHDQRVLIHFDDTPELDKVVILDPQWLVDVFKKVITIPPFKKSKREHREQWKKLEEKGILEKKLLNDLWDPLFDSRENFDVNSLINMMEKFGLLCPWPSSDQCGSPSEYLVPSMLMSPPKNVTDLFSSAGIPSLFVKFKSGQLPIGLFPRLVLMVMQWCTKEGLNQEHPQLHHNFVRFYTHPAKGISLILLCRSSFIEIVVHQGKCKAEASKNERLNLPSVLSQDTPQVEFARTVCRQLGLILECMRREFHWLKNMAYEMSVCCPICCTRKIVKNCNIHHASGCKEEECLHFWSESELHDCKKPVVCTRGVDVEDYRVPLECFAAWFPFLLKAVSCGFCQCSMRVTYFHTNAYNPSLTVASARLVKTHHVTENLLAKLGNTRGYTPISKS